MSRLSRDRTAEPVSRDQILRHLRGQGNIHFPYSADHEQDWQPYPVDPYSAILDDHTYQIQPKNEQDDAERDGQICRSRPNSQARMGTEKIAFSCSDGHEQNWQPYPIDTCSATSDKHRYVGTYCYYLFK